MGDGGSPRTSWLREALIAELIVAGGFPLSTDQLRDLLLLDPHAQPVTAREAHLALDALHLAGHITRARWPGPEHPHLTYWVLPTSPWAPPGSHGCGGAATG